MKGELKLKSADNLAPIRIQMMDLVEPNSNTNYKIKTVQLWGLFFLLIFGLYYNYTMALPKHITVEEDVHTLKLHAKKGNGLIKKRMRLLIELKKPGATDQSKRALATKLGLNHNSVTKWRKMYEEEGIESLLKDGRTGGFKPSVVTKEEHEKIKAILNDQSNGIVGYAELLKWVQKELHKEMKYITLLKYVQRHFGAKIKTARKSHVKKDEQAVEAFKKTSVKNAKK